MHIGARLSCAQSISCPYAVSTSIVETSASCEVKVFAVRPVDAVLDPASLPINLWYSFYGACIAHSDSDYPPSLAATTNTLRWAPICHRPAFVSAEVEIE